MRIIVLLGLLIACFGIAVLSKGGKKSLSRQLNCSDERLLEILYNWNVTSITWNDIRCAASYLGNFVYHSLINGGNWFQRFVHILQSSLIMTIMVNLYYFIVTLLACDIFITTVIKPRFFPSNEPTRSDDSDNNESLDDFCSSCVSSTVSIHMLFEQESSSSFVSLNEITRSKSFCCLTASLSNVAWTAESFAPEEGLLYYQRRHSFSGFQRSSSLQSLTGLRRDVRLCRSLSSLSRVSGGSSMIRDVLNLSSFDFPSTHSSIALPPLPASSGTSSFQSVCSSRSSGNLLTPSRGSHDLFALSRSRENAALATGSGASAALSGSSIGQLPEDLPALPIAHQESSHSVVSRHSVSSIALSQCSHPTVWTMYRYPVPGSITSSDPHQFQLQRSEREYVFVQRPFATPLPRVDSWLQNNFFASPARSDANSDPGMNHRASEDGASGSRVDDPNPSNQMIQANQGSQHSQQTAYLVNTQKTEVVLSGVPGDVTKTYSNHLVQMLRARTRGSMIELHHTAQWSPLSTYASLPNICEEIGLRNGVSFNIHVTEPLVTARMHRESSVDERDHIFDHAMDSISIVCERVERRDQALRDAARARIEQNRERQIRRLRLFREFEEVEPAPTPAPPAPLSFMEILKKETYKQVFVPLLLHAGKEMVLSILPS